MFRTAQANALGAVLPGALCILGVVGIGPHAQGAEAVRPFQEFDQPGILDIRDNGLNLVCIDLPACTIDGKPVPFLNNFIPDRHLAPGNFNVQIGSPHHCGFSKLSSDKGGMAGSPAPAGENAFRGEHAVYIIRLGFRADHDHPLAFFFGPGGRHIGVKSDHPASRTRGNIQSLGQHPPL